MDSDMNIEVKFQLFGENVKTLVWGWAVSLCSKLSWDICEKSYSIRISKDPFRHILELVSLKFKKLLEAFRFM